MGGEGWVKIPVPPGKSTKDIIGEFSKGVADQRFLAEYIKKILEEEQPDQFMFMMPVDALKMEDATQYAVVRRESVLSKHSIKEAKLYYTVSDKSSEAITSVTRRLDPFSEPSLRVKEEVRSIRSPVLDMEVGVSVGKDRLQKNERVLLVATAKKLKMFFGVPEDSFEKSNIATGFGREAFANLRKEGAARAIAPSDVFPNIEDEHFQLRRFKGGKTTLKVYEGAQVEVLRKGSIDYEKLTDVTVELKPGDELIVVPRIGIIFGMTIPETS